MAYLNFVDELDKTLNKVESNETYCIYSKLLQKFTVAFDIDVVKIKKPLQTKKVSYEDLPKSDITSFNETLTGDFKYPLSYLSLFAIRNPCYPSSRRNYNL